MQKVVEEITTVAHVPPVVDGVPTGALGYEDVDYCKLGVSRSMDVTIYGNFRVSPKSII